MFKRTTSEAELFALQARLREGFSSIARQGALKLTLPIGFSYTETDAAVLDPERPQASKHARGFSSFCAHRLGFYNGPPLSNASLT